MREPGSPRGCPSGSAGHQVWIAFGVGPTGVATAAHRARPELRRENVFVYCDATPPCSGISPVSHPSDEVKASCLKLIKQTDAFVHRMHAAGVFDAALFENVKACIDAW